MSDRLRRFGRRTYRHYRTLARDPEVRQAAKSLAILGGMSLALWKVPHLQVKAFEAMRRSTKPRTAARHALGALVAGTRATRRAAKQAWKYGEKTKRLGRRAAHAGISTSELEKRLQHVKAIPRRWA